MMKRFPATCLAALLLVATSSHVTTFGEGTGIRAASKPEEVGLSSDRLPRIHETVQRYLDSGQLAGAVTLVARRGRVAHFEAHGVMDLDSKTPMRKDAHLPHRLDVEAGDRRRDHDADGGRKASADRSGLALHPRVQGTEGRGDQGWLRRSGGGAGTAAPDSRLLHGSRKPRDHDSRSADALVRTQERQPRQPPRRAASRGRVHPHAGRPDPEARAGAARLPAGICNGPTACSPAWTPSRASSRSLRDRPTTPS